jgi:hypothetical protein
LPLPVVIYTVRKIPFISSFPGNCATSVSISTLMCLWAIYIFLGSVHIFPCSRIFWKYINLSQIFECRNWETEQYDSVVEITVSFLRIHKWEPAIYIGFSSAFLSAHACHTLYLPFFLPHTFDFLCMPCLALSLFASTCAPTLLLSLLLPLPTSSRWSSSSACCL